MVLHIPKAYVYVALCPMASYHRLLRGCIRERYY